MKTNYYSLPSKRNLVIAIASLYFLTSCDVKSIYNFSVSEPAVLDTVSVEHIKLYIETSASMRGYVNTNVAGSYPLKDVVPNIVTDLDNHFGLETQLITISDRQQKFPYSKNRFFEQLSSGNIFKGKSSKLQHIFSDVISKTEAGEVSILISDCIPDLGRVDTQTEGTRITNHIYGTTSVKQSYSAAVFQYKSDFNGTYYYNRNNNDGVSQRKRPYYDETLTNRPFYIWVFGDQLLVSKILEANKIKGYDRVHVYNMAPQKIAAGLLKNPSSGRISINPESQSLLIKEVDARTPALFTIGLDAKRLSLVQQDKLKDTAIYNVNPVFMEEHIAFSVQEKDALLSKDIKYKSKIQSSRYSHFLEVIVSDFALDTEQFNIDIYNKEPLWIKDANLKDDLGIMSSALQHKTYGFDFISNAFAKAYTAKTPLLQFTFTKQQPK